MEQVPVLEVLPQLPWEAAALELEEQPAPGHAPSLLLTLGGPPAESGAHAHYI